MSRLDLVKKFDPNSLIPLSNLEGKLVTAVRAAAPDAPMPLGEMSREQSRELVGQLSEDNEHLGLVASAAAAMRFPALVERP